MSKTSFTKNYSLHGPKFFGVYFIIALGLWVLIVARILKAKIVSVLVPEKLPMAEPTALCFILSGLALMFITHQKRTAGCLFLAIIVSVCTIAVVPLDIFANLTRLHAVSVIKEMSVPTAVAFLFLSLSLVLLGKSRYIWFSQYLLHTVTFISFVVLLGHIFDVAELYRFTFIAAMASYTAVGLLIISITASLFQPRVGLTGLFQGKGIGNVMARKVFFQLALVIMILGYLWILVHREGIMDPALATGLLVISCVLIFLYIVEKTTRLLNRLEKESRMAQKNFKLAIESAPYALVLTDRDGKIIMLNNATEKLYGFTRSDLIGREVETVIPESLHDDYRSKRDLFFSDPAIITYSIEENLYAKRSDGSEFPVELVLTPIRSQDQLYVLASITDMSVRKHQEQLIREHLNELQFRNQELEQITAMVSHDLQEPLRTIANYAQLLEEDYASQFTADAKAYVSSMKATVSRMTMMVKHLLDFARLGRHRELSQTDCETLLGIVKQDLNDLLVRSGAVIKITNMPTLYAYETELRQLFQNLIHNAIKFSKQNVPPHIEIGCRYADDFYEFSVSDNGIGVPPSEQLRIFHIFQQAQTGSPDDKGGYGIGLAFAKKITEMHGGKIWVDSVPGEGTSFTFTIINLKMQRDVKKHMAN